MGQIKRISKALLLPLLQFWQHKKRQAEIKRQAASINRRGLVAAFDAIPLPAESVVLIHSSLKSLGYVEGGAQAVVDALLESFVAGRRITVMLPTFSIDGDMYSTLRSGRVFDLRKTPSNIGLLPETFRRQPSALRSLHPTHSFAAIGPRAEWLVSDHHLAGTNFGRRTPMGRLLETDGYIFGLGSDIGHVTFYHCLEDIEAFPVSIYAADGPFEAQCIDAAGKVHRLRLPAHAPTLRRVRIDHPDSGPLREFIMFQLTEDSGLTWQRVGEARCWLVSAPLMYYEMLRLMRQGITIYTTTADLKNMNLAPSSPRSPLPTLGLEFDLISRH